MFQFPFELSEVSLFFHHFLLELHFPFFLRNNEYFQNPVEFGPKIMLIYKFPFNQILIDITMKGFTSEKHKEHTIHDIAFIIQCNALQSKTVNKLVTNISK